MTRLFTSIAGIRDPYSRRILANLLGKDPFGVYRGTPAALARLIDGLTARHLRLTAPGRAWSIGEILHHLADSEIVMGFRYRKALAEPGTDLQSFDEGRWARHLRYAGSDPRAKLALFTALRQDHVAMLSGLTPTEWRRYGLHAERGKESVERMMQLTAGHDLNHRRQIAELRATALGKGRT